jgi:hypothetical protein
MKKRTFMAALATGAGLLESRAETAVEHKETLSVEIALPFYRGERRIAYRFKPPQLHVLVKNVSNMPQLVLADSCSWGYSMLSFSGTDATGQTWTAKKAPRDWKSNYPKFWTIPAGETLVLDVDVDDRKIWEGFPQLKTGSEIHKVKAIFETDPTEPISNPPNWKGRLESPILDITFYR